MIVCVKTSLGQLASKHQWDEMTLMLIEVFLTSKNDKKIANNDNKNKDKTTPTTTKTVTSYLHHQPPISGI